MEAKRVILLLSGGIDSTTLLAKLSSDGYNIIALSFDYGQKHEIELNYAKMNAAKYGVSIHEIIKLDKKLFSASALVNKSIGISTYEEKELPNGEVNSYVPYRNLIFISSALSVAESMNISSIYMAFNSDDQKNYWDCSMDFVHRINSISKAPNTIQIKTPFIQKSKAEVIQLAKELNVNLTQTITCYQPTGTNECGVCLSCISKKKALKNA